MTRGRTRLTGIIPRFFQFYACVSFALCGDYGIPIEIKVWDTGRTPLAHMVDITNGFGLKVLAEHNFLNDNNIAFSPYGLMGILVALYEGVDGESSYQIQRGMQLPWNRNVMRIGFRDIHRTLKTYFVPEEGFLAGLALNNENVTFNEGYKKILRFYGFDLDNDQIPTLTPESNNTINISTSTEQSTAADSTPTTIITTESLSTMSTKEETTINADAETIDDIDPRGPTSTLSTSAAASNSESTTVLVTENTTFQSTTTAQSTSLEDLITSSSSTIQMTFTTLPTASEVTSTASTVEATTETTTSTVEATTETTTSPPSSITTDEFTNSDNLSTREMTSTTTSDSTTPDSDASSTITTVQNTNPEETSTITQMNTETSEASSTPITSTTFTSDGMQTDSTTASTLETLERRKRSLVHYGILKSSMTDDYLLYRSFEIPPAVNTNLNTNNMFLVNGLRNVQVSYMHYDTVLEHAYLPHLEASALRLPLDSDRYYLLVVLPSRGGAVELGRLLARMGRESDLSDVYAALRPRRVRAIVPSFTVKGHVTLTTDLQKLGIRDVFEPRQHDFTPLTRQAGVYVRSIEQAVSVAIRKYQPDDQKKNRYVSNRNRVFFSATYPFLYFVMDSSIHVALMAGKMVDPLNTRIL